MSWSSGKDSAYTLHILRQEGTVNVVRLLTTLTRPFDRVSMHGVRSELLNCQARELGLAVHAVEIPFPCPNSVYAEKMTVAVAAARDDRVEAIAFGDLFLEDVRAYREERLSGTGIRPLFPLWGRPTRQLADEMISAGLKAVLVAVDPRVVPARFAGREFDRELLRELPEGVDPLGERGEFHTFAYDGPMFRRAIEWRRGEVVHRDGFVFQDLLPADAP
ncbi:MAG: Dph6-related ATP pyrophosphatase [Thermoplasmata archaeon]